MTYLSSFSKYFVCCLLWWLLCNTAVLAQRKSTEQYFTTQLNEGQKLMAKGLAKQAAQTWLKAIRYADSLKVFNKSVAEICASVAEMYAAQARYAEAIPYLQRSLVTIESSTDSSNYQKRADGLAKLASYYKNAEQITESVAAYQEAVVWQLKANNAKVISLYTNYADALAKANDAAQELRCREASLRWAFHFKGEKSIEAAQGHISLARFYSKNQAYKSAIPHYQKAVAIIKQIPAKTNALAQIYVNLGFAYHQISADQNALDALLLALNLLQKTPHNDSRLAVVYQMLGSVYDASEDYNRALNYKKKALEIYRKIPEAQANVVKLYNNIGNSYLLKNQTSVSRSYQKKALTEALKGEDTLTAANICNNLALNYLESNLSDSSALFLNKGIVFLADIHYTRGIELASLYASLADLHLRNKRTAEAQNAISAAMQANKHTQMGGTDAFNQYFSLSLLIDLFHQQALVYELNKQTPQALAYIFRADSLANATNSSISDADLFEIATVAHKARETGVRLCYQMFVSSQKQEFVEKAFYLTERGKMQTLLKTLSENKRRELAGIPDSLQHHEHLLKQQLSVIREVTAEVATFATPEEATSEYDSLQQQYEKIYARYEQWQEMVKVSYPSYFQLKKDVSPISIAALQQSLKPLQHCVSYFVGDSTEYAIVFTSKNLHFIKLPSAPQNLETQVRNLRRTIMLAAHEDFAIQSQQLYQRIWQPIAQYLPADGQVIVIPDGALLYLPFEALKTEKNYLLNTHDIAYHYSATLWQQTVSNSQKKNNSNYDQSLVAFAPVFDAPLKKWQPTEVLRSNSSPKTEKITPLPASEMEVKSLDSLFRHYNQTAKVYVKDNATENSIKSGILEHSKFVHLATHGIVDDSNPDFSGLLFLRDSVSKEDGKLYASEIYGLKINADLVVLSACESGLGKMVEGEGLIGLGRSFMYAGATNLSVSLWRVADEPTRILMTYFYQNILQQEKNGLAPSYSQALRQAKIQLIAQHKKYSFAYYWSPFVLVGDGN